MLYKGHSPPDLLVLGPALRALPQVELALQSLWLRELAIEMSCYLPRNMPRKHG
jgi:hypothetical protein